MPFVDTCARVTRRLYQIVQILGLATGGKLGIRVMDRLGIQDQIYIDMFTIQQGNLWLFDEQLRLWVLNWVRLRPVLRSYVRNQRQS